MSANLTPSKGEEQELRKAALAGDIPAMEALLKIGANVNGENNYGAQVHAKTKAGETALIIAARNGHPQVVDLLLKEGAQANAFNSDGWTALHFAVDRNHEAVVQTLLQCNADPTLRTKDGKTPMDLVRDSAPMSLKNMLHEATVQQEMRSPIKRTSAPSTPSMSRIASPPRVMSPEIAPRSRPNRSLMNELNAAAPTSIVDEGVLPMTFQPVYAPVPVRQELFDTGVRNSITERLIELVERQAAEIEVLRQEVSRLNLRVTELARIGFPHTLELKLDGRLATYHLGPSPLAAATAATTTATAATPVVPASSTTLAPSSAHVTTPSAAQVNAISPAPAVVTPTSKQTPTRAAAKLSFDDIPIRPAKDLASTEEK